MRPGILAQDAASRHVPGRFRPAGAVARATSPSRRMASDPTFSRAFSPVMCPGILARGCNGPSCTGHFRPAEAVARAPSPSRRMASYPTFSRAFSPGKRPSCARAFLPGMRQGGRDKRQPFLPITYPLWEKCIQRISPVLTNQK